MVEENKAVEDREELALDPAGEEEGKELDRVVSAYVAVAVTRSLTKEVFRALRKNALSVEHPCSGSKKIEINIKGGDGYA